MKRHQSRKEKEARARSTKVTSAIAGCNNPRRSTQQRTTRSEEIYGVYAVRFAAHEAGYRI